MGSQQVSIIAVNADDIASYNQAKYLLEKFLALSNPCAKV